MMPSSVSRRWSISQRIRKERIVEREDAEGMPDPPASRLRNACCSSLPITTFQRISHSVFCYALHILLLLGSLHSLHFKKTSLIIATTMVDSCLQSRSRASKGEPKAAPESIDRTVETLSIFRHSRVADIRLRLEDVMWSHGG